jgi:hypothetical protein
MSSIPQTNGTSGANGGQWTQQSFGPWKYIVGTSAAALVFAACGWQLYTARQDALAAQHMCREELRRLEDRIEGLQDLLRGRK